MTDYISRDAANQIIAAQCGECADACLEFDGIQPDCNQCLLYGAKKAIESIPAADVRPVVRGKWKNNHCSACGMMPMGEEMWERCDFTPPKFEWFMNYCPNCGADMREES